MKVRKSSSADHYKSVSDIIFYTYYIVQQFPKEIHARRKELVTTLKRLKDEGARAYFVCG